MEMGGPSQPPYSGPKGVQRTLLREDTISELRTDHNCMSTSLSLSWIAIVHYCNIISQVVRLDCFSKELLYVLCLVSSPLLQKLKTTAYTVSLFVWSDQAHV